MSIMDLAIASMGLAAAALAGTSIGYTWGEKNGRHAGNRTANTEAGRRVGERAESGRQQEAGRAMLDEHQRRARLMAQVRADAAAGLAPGPAARKAADLEATLILPPVTPAQAVKVCAAMEWWCPECGNAGAIVPRAKASPAAVALECRYAHLFAAPACSGSDVKVGPGAG